MQKAVMAAVVSSRATTPLLARRFKMLRPSREVQMKARQRPRYRLQCDVEYFSAAVMRDGGR